MVSAPSCCAAALLTAWEQGCDSSPCLFWGHMNASFPNSINKAAVLASEFMGPQRPYKT